jgi:hypothetical protein
MVGTDRAETVTSSKQVTITPAAEKKYVTFEATVSTDDTVTLGSMASLLNAKLLKKSDGTEVTCTVATNVVTVTGAGLTNIPVVGIAYGS